jgi:hypothetical protein
MFESGHACWVGRILKEVAMSCVDIYHDVRLQGMKKRTENCGRIHSFPARIETVK